MKRGVIRQFRSLDSHGHPLLPTLTLALPSLWQRDLLWLIAGSVGGMPPNLLLGPAMNTPKQTLREKTKMGIGRRPCPRPLPLALRQREADAGPGGGTSCSRQEICSGGVFRSCGRKCVRRTLLDRTHHNSGSADEVRDTGFDSTRV